MEDHPIIEMMKQAAMRDFVMSGRGCGHCESTNLVCIDRVLLGSSMLEGFRCQDCGEITNHEIENY